MHDVELPADLGSVGEARRFVHDALVAHHADDVVPEAYLVVSELAANAVLHAHSDYRVGIDVGDAHVRVEVSDGGPGMPTLRAFDPASESGRGLHLVAALSRAWGVAPTRHGKAVWAELPRP